MEQIPIRLNDKIVGSATAERQGMHVLIKCVCEAGDGDDSVALVTDGAEIDLGIGIPMGNLVHFSKRVLWKQWEKRTALRLQSRCKAGEAYAFIPGQEFEGISELPNARFNVESGMIVVKTDHSSVRPTGQWSEPSTSE